MAAITLRKAARVGISRRVAQMPTLCHMLHSVPEDPAGGNLVPENVIPPEHPEHYWSPHPDTGVFGPTGEEGRGGHSATTTGTAVANRLDSDVDQRAWFRTNVELELDKNAPVEPTVPKPDGVAGVM